MKIIGVGIKMLYWITALGWIVVLPVGVATFFIGGWFFLIGYLCIWDWVNDLAYDHVALERAATDIPLSGKVTKEFDWMLARTGDKHPATVLVQRNGEQDIGGINGSQDLGYPVDRRDIRGLFPPQMQCLDCRARFEPPYPTICPFCGYHEFARPSTP